MNQSKIKNTKLKRKQKLNHEIDKLIPSEVNYFQCQYFNDMYICNKNVARIRSGSLDH